MKTLTPNQREALEKIQAVRDLFHKRFADDVARGLFSDFPNVHPSEWVHVHTLTSSHRVAYRDLKALVAKGAIEIRPTDGFGNEVRIAKRRSCDDR